MAAGFTNSRRSDEWEIYDKSVLSTIRSIAGPAKDIVVGQGKIIGLKAKAMGIRTADRAMIRTMEAAIRRDRLSGDPGRIATADAMEAAIARYNLTGNKAHLEGFGIGIQAGLTTAPRLSGIAR